MPSNASLLFELQRRIVLFRPGTVMPDGSSLGFDGNPNAVTDIPSESRTPGEILIYTCPINSRYGDSAGNQWYKKEAPNTWRRIIDSEDLADIIAGDHASRSFKQEIVGDGSTTSFEINHELDSEDVIVQVADKETKYVAYPIVELTNDNKATIIFSNPPAGESEPGQEDQETYIVRVLSL